MPKRLQSPHIVFGAFFVLIVLFGLQPSHTLGAFTASVQNTQNTAGYGVTAAPTATATPAPSVTAGATSTSKPARPIVGPKEPQTCGAAIVDSARRNGIFAYQFGADTGADVVTDQSGRGFDALNYKQKNQSSFVSPCQKDQLAALNFKGNGGVVVTMGEAVLPSDLTVEVWFRTSESGTIVGFYPEPIPGPKAGQPSFKLDVVRNNGELVFSTAGPSGFDTVHSGFSVADGQWHHAVAVRDDTAHTLQLFVDGHLVSSETTRHPMNLQPGYFRFGEDRIENWPGIGNNPQGFRGDLAFGAAYRRALSEQEIDQHFAARR
ncbi:LamG domain-containing protein [Staphylococcus chromogenes]|nr:LamG domain-containing protein [Staphylococcus chromogenes]